MCLAAGADIVSVVSDITLNPWTRRRARENGSPRPGRRERKGSRSLLRSPGRIWAAAPGFRPTSKRFAALGVHGASVITALTAQNTTGVRAIHYAPPEIVAAQLAAVLEDFVVAAVKIGMLGTAEIVGAVAEGLFF